MELRAERVRKQYGSKIAVEDMSFTLHRGVTGLLGENGAGKTTLMRILCGILTPTGGKISYDGIPVSEERYRNVLGYLPQDFGYYPEFTGMDFLMYFAALKGLDRKSARTRCEELMDVVRLSDVRNKRIRAYSGGMRQRLGIAQAIINRPEVLILDEPTSGLDPRERARFRGLIDEIGKTSVVLLSTHIVSDVEDIAREVIMMKSGRVVWQGAWDGSGGGLESFYLEKFREEDEGVGSISHTRRI